MGSQPYQRKRIGALNWTYRKGADDLLTADFLGGEALRDVDENHVRIRGFYRAGGDVYFVKVFKAGGIGRSLKSLVLGHVAEKEFASSQYLSERGVSTPEAVAVGVTPMRDRAVIIFRAIPGAVPVLDLFLEAGSEQRGRYLSSIAAVTGILHRASFHHLDYHGGNVLARRGDSGTGRLWVVDLHRSAFPRAMSGRRGINNIADMLHSLRPALTGADIPFFLSRYRERNPRSRWDAGDAGRIIADRIEKIEARRLISRTKRCFMNSSEFFVRRRRDEIVYGLRGLAIEEVARYVDTFTRGDRTILKRDKKATVALVKTDREEVCLKAYERLGISEKVKALLSRARGHVSWRSARGLSLRGFLVPRHLYLVIKRRFLLPRAVYLITEPIHPALEMDRFIQRHLARDGPPLVRFAAALGALVGSLHRGGIYHRDLKATNIAVEKRGGGFSFSFLDLDAVSFTKEVSLKRKAKNLAQLFLSTPRTVDADARRTFFSAYLEALGEPDHGGEIARLVGEMVRGRDILYVSANGDVIEKADELFDRLWGGKES